MHPHGACMSPGSAVQRQPQGRSQTQGVVGARGLQAARCTPGSPCPRLWSWFQVVVAFSAPHSPVSTTEAMQGAAAEPCTRCPTSLAPLEPAGRSSKGADGSHPHLSPTGTLGASSHPRKASSGAPSVDLGTRKHLPRPPPAPTLEGRARGTRGLVGRQTPGQRRTGVRSFPGGERQPQNKTLPGSRSTEPMSKTRVCGAPPLLHGPVGPKLSPCPQRGRSLQRGVPRPHRTRVGSGGARAISGVGEGEKKIKRRVKTSYETAPGDIHSPGLAVIALPPNTKLLAWPSRKTGRRKVKKKINDF